MDKYEKIRLVGRGAYGAVFLCHRKYDKKLVILKEIPADQMSVDERQASMNEAKVLSMLNHPNVVAYYESFLEDKTMTIVMEYVQGGTLFDYLKQRSEKLLEEKEVLHFFGQMVYTLQHVHAKLILHRDLKSQNILLNKNKNIVKIGDFGISKVLSSKSKAFTVVGTPCYISPELCEGKPYNQKSDIWALGCILYELMTLKRPFDASTLPALVMKIMKGCFDPVSDIYSQDLKKLLMSMLHVDPNQRPTAAQIMCQPFLINVGFKLYVDLGSIPCTNRYKKTSRFSCSNSYVSDSTSIESGSPSNCLHLKKLDVKKEPNIWLFESKSDNVVSLPPATKDEVKYATLGSNCKMGVTAKGFLISWNVLSPCILVQDELNNKEFIKAPAYISTIVDERVAVNIVSVACGTDFTICLSGGGVVFTFGKVSSGCLGHTSRKDILQPTIVEALFSHNIRDIACGPRHVLAVTEENEVFAWGFGNHGCLGLEKSDLQPLPQLIKVIDEEKPEKVFCGVDCSFIVTESLSLLACGSNRHNKLAMDSGEGHQMDEVKVFTPVKSEPLPHCKVVSVSAGKSHTVFLCDNGEVYSVGSNRYFQLGWGNSGLDYSMPAKIEKLKDFKVELIACSDSFTLAVTSEKHLFSWGKCPGPLMSTKDQNICDVGIPSFLESIAVISVACNFEDCIIVGERREQDD